jgi:hypothetical protein
LLRFFPRFFFAATPSRKKPIEIEFFRVSNLGKYKVGNRPYF